MFLKKHGVVVTMFVFIAKQNLLLNKKKNIQEYHLEYYYLLRKNYKHFEITSVWLSISFSDVKYLISYYYTW